MNILRTGGLAALMLIVCTTATAQSAVEPAFTIDVTAAVDPVFPDEGVGYAAVAFDGTNLWVSKWASDRLTRLGTDGSYVDSFAVPGLSGTRGLSWDGTHLWAANATTTIHRVDPLTQTIASSVTAPIPARYASFDPFADSGNGGLWIGNFNTEILLIDLQGNTLQTIPAEQIPFGGRYGITLDYTTEASPILWVFFQGGTNNSELGVIELPSGTPRLATQDILAFTQGLTSGLAGGISYSNGTQAGMPQMLALIQGTPNNVVVGLNIVESPIFKDGFEMPVP